MGEHPSSRLDRTTAKHKPHRTEERFFAAKSDAKQACEELRAIIQRSHIHDAMKTDLLNAVARAESEIKELTPTQSHPGSSAKELAKQVSHLNLAETWVAAADRVLIRMNGQGPANVRELVIEHQEQVMWCVRADEWDGRLTAAVTQLEKTVKEAEVHASRQVS